MMAHQQRRVAEEQESDTPVYQPRDARAEPDGDTEAHKVGRQEPEEHLAATPEGHVAGVPPWCQRSRAREAGLGGGARSIANIAIGNRKAALDRRKLAVEGGD